ncbi:MAG: metallophosphoesterase family protein [Desulfatiglandaceae bacterium]
MGDNRVFIVGDIHGCLGMLERLMEKVSWQPERDQLIFLGDYIDRGGNSKGVVDYLVELKRSSPNVQFIIGNHEVMLLDYLAGRNRDLYFANAGHTTLRSYMEARPVGEEVLIPQEHMEFYYSLKPYIEAEDYYVVHAGFRPGVDPREQTLEDMVWIREPFIYSDYDFGKKVIFGHTPFQRPLVMENKFGLDTGAVYGNRLTCLELPEIIFHSVEAKGF